MTEELAFAFADEHLLVVEKPAGMVVHPGAGVDSETLVQALAGKVAGGPDPERPGIVHRLDRDTSGLLVVARSEPVHAALQEAIRRREVEREYLALVAGRPDARTGTIDAPLGRDRANRTVMSTRTDKPRRAVTHFEVIEELPGRSLLRVTLDTGRTHQIRAHLAAIGHPVCGDQAYGGRAAGRPLGLTRQFLHSARLAFRHPVTGEQVECESKPPADLRSAMDAARRGAASGGPVGS
jgi:23S rRNA pseudouridine1911/1915/1917 synthase